MGLVPELELRLHPAREVAAAAAFPADGTVDAAHPGVAACAAEPLPAARHAVRPPTGGHRDYLLRRRRRSRKRPSLRLPGRRDHLRAHQHGQRALQAGHRRDRGQVRSQRLRRRRRPRGVDQNLHKRNLPRPRAEPTERVLVRPARLDPGAHAAAAADRVHAAARTRRRAARARGARGSDRGRSAWPGDTDGNAAGASAYGGRTRAWPGVLRNVDRARARSDGSGGGSR